MLYGRGVVGEGVMSVVWEGVLSEKGDGCCMGGDVGKGMMRVCVGEGVMSVAWEGVLSEKG